MNHNDQVVKPPLGLMPQWRYKELRLDAINKAMDRYMNAKYSIPPEWLDERAEIRIWLRKHLPTSPYLND